MTTMKTCVLVGVGLARPAGEGDGCSLATGLCVGWARAPCAPQAAASIGRVRIAARRWTVEARPERGGRITPLRLDGQELLDQGIGVDQPTADDFVDGGAWGWDEMVPTVERTGTLPDHGEAWRFPWRLGGRGDSSCQ